ncbi:MAG: glutamate synthase subunit beta [Candidatus Omnitrophica bacterium]|nr:glutamate synthase subunit beta [Candidatus Omnitrophota bacterium]
MGDQKGFLKVSRQDGRYRDVWERVSDFKYVAKPRSEKQSREQASRCMDCSTPFCHWGCPIGNYIPEWNDHMFRGNWEAALALLEETNNFPEITGRICPALCEYACVLGLNDDAVTIRENELAIVESAFRGGLLRPRAPAERTGKRVAVVGSGPAGLSCAAQLNRAGHNVTVFERDDKPGGILRYGVPDFKLEKDIIDRRVEIWKKEGVVFKTGVNVGADLPAEKLLEDFDAVVLAGGSRVPRDLKIEGRELKGIHFAMDYLCQANRTAAGEKVPAGKMIDAKGKKVVVIGGGDTGSDCVGTAHRQGASCVVQIEVLPKPAECRTEDYPWPGYPLLLKTTSSHEEGGERRWAVLTKRFIGEKGCIKRLSCVKVAFEKAGGSACPAMKEVPDSAFEIEADLVILAVGFLHPEHSGLVADLGVGLDERGNVKTDAAYMTSAKKVFSAGDMRRGQSLAVWAISEGRRAAHCVDKYLMGESTLPFM